MMLSETLRAEINEMIALYPAGRERSAILPALYAIQREFGYCALEAQNELAAILNLEPAEVGAVVGFYHMLKTQPKGDYHVEVCTNVPCMLRGAGKCMNHLEEKLGIHHGHTTPDDKYSLDHMECLGSCGTAPMVSVTERSTGKIRYFEEIDSAEDVDKMLAVIENEHGFVSLERWTPEGDPENTGKPAGPYTHGGMENPVLMGRIDTPDSHKIETYLADGGYELAADILKTKQPQEVVDAIKASGVRGRGGAGFPTGVKWGFLPQGVFPRYLVINADESEPGTFKDRILMEYDPHQLIESAIISAFAIQAERVFIYIRGEYYFAAQRLNEAIADARAKGYLGQGVFGTNINVDILVHRGAGAYICGEETALLSSLEGYRGFPRLKPPFPAIEGLYSKPTIVNNVESICNVVHVMKKGVAWYRSFGTEKSPGVRIFCLSGNVKRPGLYELPHAVPLRELIYKYGGGPEDDNARIKAVIPGGLSVQMLTEDQLDTPMDYESVQAAGSALGSVGVIVIDERSSMIDIATRILGFYREESCGKCTPCREGTPWLESTLLRIQAGGGRNKDIELMTFIADNLGGKSFCPFGYAAVWSLQSNLAKYRPEWDEFLLDSNPADVAPVIPIRPIYRPDTGQPSSLRDTVLPLEGESPLLRDTMVNAK